MRLLTVQQLCERLAISRATAYRLFGRGEIRTVAIGRARRIPEPEVEAYVQRLYGGGGQETGHDAAIGGTT